MFEKASRMKLRFDTPQGMLNVEDLWDLPLTATRPERANLDDIAKSLNRQVKDATDEESFVIKDKKPDDALHIAFEIVKHVISVKLDEATIAAKAKDAKLRKQQIMNLIAQKENEQLAASSIEDLRKMVEEL